MVLVAAQVLAPAQDLAVDMEMVLQTDKTFGAPNKKSIVCQVWSKPYSSTLTDSAPALLRRSVSGSHLPQLGYHHKACSQLGKKIDSTL